MFYQIKCIFIRCLGVGNGNGSDLRFQIITDGKVTFERAVNEKLTSVCFSKLHKKTCCYLVIHIYT